MVRVQGTAAAGCCLNQPAPSANLPRLAHPAGARASRLRPWSQIASPRVPGSPAVQQARQASGSRDADPLRPPTAAPDPFGRAPGPAGAVARQRAHDAAWLFGHHRCRSEPTAVPGSAGGSAAPAVSPQGQDRATPAATLKAGGEAQRLAAHGLGRPAGRWRQLLLQRAPGWPPRARDSNIPPGSVAAKGLQGPPSRRGQGGPRKPLAPAANAADSAAPDRGADVGPT